MGCKIKVFPCAYLNRVRPRVSDFVSAVTARLNFSPDQLKNVSALRPGTGRGGGARVRNARQKGEARIEKARRRRAPKNIKIRTNYRISNERIYEIGHYQILHCGTDWYGA